MKRNEKFYCISIDKNNKLSSPVFGGKGPTFGVVTIYRDSIEELDKIAATEELTELQKEAIFGVKALMMGARRLGSGIAGKAKATTGRMKQLYRMTRTFEHAASSLNDAGGSATFTSGNTINVTETKKLADRLFEMRFA